MQPLPLSSTHIPYTTLFRSSCIANAVRDGSCTPRLAHTVAVHLVHLHIGDHLGRRHRNQGDVLVGIDAASTKVITDRKSTRLNSSHSQISYAVFCLKKITKL